MGRYKRSKKDKSFISAAKGSTQPSARRFLNLWLGFVLAGCSHGQAQVSDKKVGPANPIEQLTFVGENENPFLSADGKKLVFQSRNRSQHSSWQIYELDLQSKKERRITFSDGDAFDPILLSSTELIYASTTDEIKEDPFGPRSLLKRPPSDLYSSDLFGNVIVRLTKQPGYDAQPFFKKKPKPALLFVSARGEILGLYQLDLRTEVVSLISSERGKEKLSPRVSPDQNTYAWIEKDLDRKSQSLVTMTTKTKVLRLVSTDEGELTGLRFLSETPNRLIYSLKTSKGSSIQVYDLEKNCTQTLHSDTDLLSSPQILSEAPKKLIYARKTKQSSQIFSKELPTDLGPCKEPLKSDKLNE